MRPRTRWPSRKWSPHRDRRGKRRERAVYRIGPSRVPRSRDRLHGRRLERLLMRYIEYYERSRTHVALDRDAPVTRLISTATAGRIVVIPQVGGLHHRYERTPRSASLVSGVTSTGQFCPAYVRPQSDVQLTTCTTDARENSCRLPECVPRRQLDDQLFRTEMTRRSDRCTPTISLRPRRAPRTRR
jgi:hypothetical protein